MGAIVGRVINGGLIEKVRAANLIAAFQKRNDRKVRDDMTEDRRVVDKIDIVKIDIIIVRHLLKNRCRRSR